MAQLAMDGVDMSKVQFQSYAFHFLFAAAKGCLFPFLTVYLRILGLTAMQVGIIIGVGSWIKMISSSFLTHCATSCNKRHLLLVLSVLSLIVSYMLLTVVPPINDKEALKFCKKNLSKGNILNGTETELMQLLGTSPLPPSTSQSNTDQNSTLSILSSSTKSPQSTVTATLSTTTTTTTPTTTTEKSTTTKKPTTVTLASTKLSHEKNRTSTVKAADRSDTEGEGEVDLHSIFNDEELQTLIDTGVNLDDLKGMSANEIYSYLSDVLEDETKEEAEEAKQAKIAENRRRNGHHHRKGRDVANSTSENHSPVDTSILDGIWVKISALQDQLQQLKKQLFAAVLVIIIIASLLGSPADKLSDDTWFEFLDSTDMLEKYGQHKSWASLGTVMIPVLSTVLIEHTDCLLAGKVLNVKLHFMAFSLLMLFVFVLSFVYPIYTERKKVQRRIHLSRGFRILFADCHCALYTLTVFVLGMLQAVLFNFLFWRVQDLGGSELVMGISVSAVAFSQLVVYILHKLLIRKLTHPGAVVLGLLLLAGRFVMYSLITSPWFVVLGESFHGMSTALVWAAVMTYPDFRLNPFVMDRSALAATNIVHVGIGMAAGSIVSGIVYDYVGLSHVLQGSCIVAIAWGLIFAIMQKCVQKKTKVRYAKLLQDDQSQSEDESFDENDWLEIALKHQK